MNMVLSFVTTSIYSKTTKAEFLLVAQGVEPLTAEWENTVP